MMPERSCDEREDSLSATARERMSQYHASIMMPAAISQ